MPQASFNETIFYNRENSSLEGERVFNSNFKEKTYGTVLGRIAVKTVFSRKWFSSLYGLAQRSKHSRKKIYSMIEKYNINTDEVEFPVSSYRSLNDFFTRKLKPEARPICKEPEILISPCDSRLKVIKIDSEDQLTVKGKRYYYYELVNDKELISKYLGGICLIFRLVPADYHRFCYVDDGEHATVVPIKGCYHASAPESLISRYFPPHHKNYREYCILRTKDFGEIIQIEVGAMTVGTIKQNYPKGGTFKKGEEKGYFEYGGSTIILLFKPDTVKIDDDIQYYSGQGIETLVRYGSPIGAKLKSPDVTYYTGQPVS